MRSPTNKWPCDEDSYDWIGLKFFIKTLDFIADPVSYTCYVKSCNNGMNNHL